MSLPITPDHDIWPIEQAIENAEIVDGAVRVSWSNGQTAFYHPLLLRENSVEPDSLHPLSRETILSPLDIPADIKAVSTSITNDGALAVTFSHGERMREYHPGWLYAHGFMEPLLGAVDSRVLWDANSLVEPITFSGVEALEDPNVFLKWLKALRDYGVARLEGLDSQEGLLEEVVKRIGPVRESNFGRMYVLEIKDDPDSNAFTSQALLQHMDMPTRKNPHGLQFLFCRDNTTTGGEGVYCDSFKIAEDIRKENPEIFQTLCDIPWVYNNRSKNSSYRADGPVVECDDTGRIATVRYNTWLRAPLIAPLDIQEKAYLAQRAFAEKAQDPAYQLVFRYRPGDLLAFDNCRVLHGRKGYDEKGGVRFIEGIYADHDDLYSSIRVLERSLLKTH